MACVYALRATTRAVSRLRVAVCTHVVYARLIAVVDVDVIGGVVVATGVVVAATKVAPQIAVVPPFNPVQFQERELVPEIVELVPALQSPVVGSTLTIVPLAVPHVPFIGAGIVTHILPFHDVPPAQDDVPLIVARIISVEVDASRI
jgi:hypothetical protein